MAEEDAILERFRKDCPALVGPLQAAYKFGGGWGPTLDVVSSIMAAEGWAAASDRSLLPQAAKARTSVNLFNEMQPGKRSRQHIGMYVYDEMIMRREYARREYEDELRASVEHYTEMFSAGKSNGSRQAEIFVRDDLPESFVTLGYQSTARELAVFCQTTGESKEIGLIQDLAHKSPQFVGHLSYCCVREHDLFTSWGHTEWNIQGRDQGMREFHLAWSQSERVKRHNERGFAMYPFTLRLRYWDGGS